MEQKYPEPIVGALILNNKEEILLVKSPKWGDLYCLPGGHIDVGETIESAVKREVKEEVGLEIDLIKVLFVQDGIFPPQFFKKKHFIFLECLCKAKTDEIKIDNKEIDEAKWVNPKDALTLNIDPYTRRFIEKYLENKE